MKITIEKTEQGIELDYDGFSEIEVLGILRYFERKVGFNMVNAQAEHQAQSKKGITIKEFVNTKQLSARLNGGLLDYMEAYPQAIHISEINKAKFLKIRNCGKNTWSELQTLID